MTRSDEPRVERAPRVCTARADEALQAARRLLGRHAVRGVHFTTMPLGGIFRDHVVVIEVLPGDADGEEGEEGKEIQMIMDIINRYVAGFSTSICSRL